MGHESSDATGKRSFRLFRLCFSLLLQPKRYGTLRKQLVWIPGRAQMPSCPSRHPMDCKLLRLPDRKGYCPMGMMPARSDPWRTAEKKPGPFFRGRGGFLWRSGNASGILSAPGLSALLCGGSPEPPEFCPEGDRIQPAAHGISIRAGSFSEIRRRIFRSLNTECRVPCPPLPVRQRSQGWNALLRLRAVREPDLLPVMPSAFPCRGLQVFSQHRFLLTDIRKE